MSYINHFYNSVNNNNNNNNNRNNKAFSLIELSIVLIIIGLLVAGITGGKSLIESAKIRNYLTEMKQYQVAVNAFIINKGRLPGDLNNDGIMGYGSNETYNAEDFPAPYDGSDPEYSIPNNVSSPFVELYLEKIIDFKPQKSIKKINDYYNTYKIGGLPELKSIEMYSFFENRKRGHIIMSKTKHGGFSLDHRIFKKIDLKVDDGIINTGIFRASCNTDKDIRYANKCNYIEYQLLKRL